MLTKAVIDGHQASGVPPPADFSALWLPCPVRLERRQSRKRHNGLYGRKGRSRNSHRDGNHDHFTFRTDLFEEIKRIAAEENWPESQAVILLARLGAKAQKVAAQKLKSSHAAFMNESDPRKRDQLGDEMIRSIFGPEAIG